MIDLKLTTATSSMGYFIIIAFRPGDKGPVLYGPQNGFETYEDADSYRMSLSIPSGTTLLITQVAGEFLYRSIAVKTLPKN